MTATMAVMAVAVAAEDSIIRPFTIDDSGSGTRSTSVRRIAATQWPEKETVADASQGVPLATMQKLARYWATEYDWRRCEAELNALPQFITEVDGLDIHFIHVRSQHEDALPLVVNHGWPGSIVEQLKIIDRLTDPDGTRRERGGRLRRGDPVDAGLRVLGKPTSTGWGPGAHGPRLGDADEAPRLHASTSLRAATGARSWSTRWASRRRRDCSPSIRTCPRPFRPTSTRLPWPATRRQPASQPRNAARTTS